MQNRRLNEVPNLLSESRIHTNLVSPSAIKAQLLNRSNLLKKKDIDM